MQTASMTGKLVFRLLVAGTLSCACETFAQDAPEAPDAEPAQAVDSAEAGSERRVRRLGDVGGDEFELDLALPDAPPGGDQPVSEFDLPDVEQNERLQQILSTLATRPGNAEALARLEELLTEVLVEAEVLAEEGRLDETAQLLSVVRNVNPRTHGLEEAFRLLEGLRNVEEWLREGASAMDLGNLVEPDRESAFYFYGLVLEAEPENGPAKQGLLDVQQGLIDRALVAAEDFDFDLSHEWLDEAARVREDQQLVDRARDEIAGFRTMQAQAIEDEIREAIIERNYDYADFILIDLIALGGFEDRVAVLRESLRVARMYGQFSPGEVIHDFFPGSDQSAPPVVVMTAGSFLMGSPANETGRSESEGPQHRVTIMRGFAMGQTEVTVDQFRLFVDSTGFKTQAENDGSSPVYDEKSGRLTPRNDVNWRHDYLGRRARGDLPVLHVTWRDAQAYVQWLSRQTGQGYRLPTEAEWEYAVRAGSVSRYWWGDGSPEEVVENLTGDGDSSRSGRTWNVAFERYRDGSWGPAPAGSFPANAFGLHDLAGNVSEWVEDCWHDTYVRAPSDGSAWVNRGCESRITRGGYWASAPEQSRSAARNPAREQLHGTTVGIRIARDL